MHRPPKSWRSTLAERILSASYTVDQAVKALELVPFVGLQR
jgi:hypothetical protein